MNRINILLALILFICLACSEHKTTEDTSVSKVKRMYILNAIQLDSAVQNLQKAVKEDKSEDTLHKLFYSARAAYKRIEQFAEYYNPTSAQGVNGADIEKVEEDNPIQTIQPRGFQVVEALLFPHLSPENKSELPDQIKILLVNVRKLEMISHSTVFSDSHVFDVVRLQIIRIITLGITGFDSPIAFNSLEESAVSLDELERILMLYDSGRNRNQFVELTKQFQSAKKYLRTAKSFDEFDRAEFITRNITPLFKTINSIQNSLKIRTRDDLRPFSSQAVSLFDSLAWNIEYFAPSDARPLTKEKIELGKLLFFDPILSKNKDRACASCHQPEHGFTDGLPTSRTMTGTQGKLKNAPTMLFAGMQNSAFYDQRVLYLEDQATRVIKSEIEMHGALLEVINLLKSSEEYSNLFGQAFGKSKDSPITDLHIRIALASFIRSLKPMNSPFDRFMQGETSAISIEAKQGFNLFAGKAKCATCHFMPFFNGDVPPNFTETEAEVLGVPSKVDTANAVIDSDLGKFNYSKATIEKHAFKTPTLRNIALTAPYMHNGIYKTLEQVIDFYNRGGGQGIGLHLENQTLPPDKLNLTEKEKNALIGFLKTLTDTTGTTSRPIRLPEVISAHGMVRQVGGRY